MLSIVLSPTFLGLLGLAAFVVSVGALTHYGALASFGAPRMGFPQPATIMELGRSDPRQLALRLLLPAIVQSILFALLISLVLFIWRRRRPVDSSAAERAGPH